MVTGIFDRLFRPGRIPRKLRAALEREGLLVCDEGIRGWLITPNVDGPGVRFRGRREGFIGWLAVSRERVLCYTFRRRQINIATSDPRMRELRVTVPEPDRLSISFESGAFRPGWRGAMEFRFTTAKARRFARVFEEQGASTG